MDHSFADGVQQFFCKHSGFAVILARNDFVREFADSVLN